MFDDRAHGLSQPSNPAVLVMGVSGAGKTTFGALLASRLSVAFVDADCLHSPESIAKMASAQPLDDADRRPWLAKLAAQLSQWKAAGVSGVMACSALKRAYRDQLRNASPGLAVVFLDLDELELRLRLERRSEHYMPPSLLQSQLDALERPSAEEGVLRLGSGSAERLVDAALAYLRGDPA